MEGRLRFKYDGTRAEIRFRLSAKGTSPFKSARTSVHSATGSRGVRISGSNAGYTMFRGSVESTGYPLHLPVSPSFPFPCVTVCHHISTGLFLGHHVKCTTFGPLLNELDFLDRFSLFYIRPDRQYGPPCLLCNGYRGSFVEVKLSGLGLNCPPILSIKVLTGFSVDSRSVPSTTALCLRHRAVVDTEPSQNLGAKYGWAIEDKPRQLYFHKGVSVPIA